MYFLKTVRVRRSRPSIPALALALMITMLFVYAVSLSAKPAEETSGAVSPRTSMDIHLPGMDVDFIVYNRCADQLQARILAAQCVQEGGAGLILSDGSEYAVIRDAAGSAAQDGTLHRSAVGLTMKISGGSSEIAAISDSVNLLRSQATETSALADALERGDTNADSIRSLLGIYRTQAQRCICALESIQDGSAVLFHLQNNLNACLAQLETAMEATSPGNLRLVHAAACAQWLGLLEELGGEGNAKGAPPL